MKRITATPTVSLFSGPPTCCCSRLKHTDSSCGARLYCRDPLVSVLASYERTCGKALHCCCRCPRVLGAVSRRRPEVPPLLLLLILSAKQAIPPRHAPQDKPVSREGLQIDVEHPLILFFSFCLPLNQTHLGVKRLVFLGDLCLLPYDVFQRVVEPNTANRYTSEKNGTLKFECDKRPLQVCMQDIRTAGVPTW